jgi:hypothetical protein
LSSLLPDSFWRISFIPFPPNFFVSTENFDDSPSVEKQTETKSALKFVRRGLTRTSWFLLHFTTFCFTKVSNFKSRISNLLTTTSIKWSLKWMFSRTRCPLLWDFELTQTLLFGHESRMFWCGSFRLSHRFGLIAYHIHSTSTFISREGRETYLRFCPWQKHRHVDSCNCLHQRLFRKMNGWLLICFVRIAIDCGMRVFCDILVPQNAVWECRQNDWGFWISLMNLIQMRLMEVMSGMNNSLST